MEPSEVMNMMRRFCVGDLVRRRVAESTEG